MSEPIINRIASTKKYVETLLRANPVYRDDDDKLVAKYHLHELNKSRINPNQISAMTLLTMQAQGKFTPADLIKRCRRKVQVEIEELRGVTWNERHGQSKDVRENIHDV